MRATPWFFERLQMRRYETPNVMDVREGSLETDVFRIFSLGINGGIVVRRISFPPTIVAQASASLQFLTCCGVALLFPGRKDALFVASLPQLFKATQLLFAWPASSLSR